MSTTQPPIEQQNSDVRPSVLEGRRMQAFSLLPIPVVISIVALGHLATGWNSPQTTPTVTRSRPTIHVVRAEYSKPQSRTGSMSEARRSTNYHALELLPSIGD